MLTKYLYLGVALALAALLSTTHLMAYRHGKTVIRAEWQEATAAANVEARQMEQRRQRNVDDAQSVAAATQARIVADARNARAQRDGLRDDLSAVRLHAAQSLAAATVTVAALSDVFQQCSRAYSELAEVADRHAADSLMYQQGWPK